MLTMKIRTEALVGAGCGGDEAALDRERPDAGEQVAAVLLVGDDRLVDEDLQEQVVDVGVVACRAAHDGDLAGQRVGAADPVDLARVGCAHDAHQQCRRARTHRRAGRRRGSTPPSTSHPASTCSARRHPNEPCAQRTDSGGTYDGDMPISGDYEPSAMGWVADQVAEYEASGGQRANTLRDTGIPIVVVTMRGHASGKVRKIGLMRVEHDGEYALIASYGGPTGQSGVGQQPRRRPARADSGRAGAAPLRRTRGVRRRARRVVPARRRRCSPPTPTIKRARSASFRSSSPRAQVEWRVIHSLTAVVHT